MTARGTRGHGPARDKKGPVQEMADRFGPDRVSTAGLAAWAIDDCVPRAVVSPETAEETAQILAFADDRGLRIVPLGGGTRRAMGNPPKGVDLVLSTARLDRILEYEPSDFVVRAQAGVPLRHLLDFTAPHGQRLALDPPLAAPSTLGGILSADASGPRRHLYGTARDLVIGVEAALPCGSLVHSGGRVVKNVAGYDLKKLFLGAIGTLGVITSVFLKLHAIPEKETLVAISFQSFKSAGESAIELILGGYELAAIDLVNRPTLDAIGIEGIPAQATCALLLLLIGDEKTNQARASEAAILCARTGSLGARTLQDEAARRVWENLGALGADGGTGSAPPKGTLRDPSIALRVSIPPREIALMAASLEKGLSRLGTVRIVGRAGNGVIYAYADASAGDELLECLRALRSLAVSLGGGLVAERIPPGMKVRFDVWGSSTAVIPLLKQVKDAFDLHGTMAPGRFVGGL